jgi:hypothetical protein
MTTPAWPFVALAFTALLQCAGCNLQAGAALSPTTNPLAAPPAELVDAVDQAQLQYSLAEVLPQRPGHTDLYALAFAGDAGEDVFRNEALYFRQLLWQRFDAAGRVIALINHPDNLGEQPYAPLATYNNLYDSLQRLGKLMDRAEDVLLLFITTHGSEDHMLYVQIDEQEYDYISPQDLRQALDDAGIRNRVIVLSACYSGGFIAPLKTPDSLIITASRADRASFGCGHTANATYFGQAWLIDALNRHDDFEQAYADASAAIATRERDEGEQQSQPQLWRGKRINETEQAQQEFADLCD